MKINYFGTPWNVNIKDYIEKISTPVGEKCGCGCGREIVAGDKGVVMDHLEEEPLGVSRKPWLLDHFLSNLGLSR